MESGDEEGNRKDQNENIMIHLYQIKTVRNNKTSNKGKTTHQKEQQNTELSLDKYLFIYYQC